MTWLTQVTQARSVQRTQAFARREELYRDFIVAASTACGEALVSNEPQIQKLVALYSMISRMRVLSAPLTSARADKVMLNIIDTYFKPNRSLRELRDLMKEGGRIDPLRDFSEARARRARHGDFPIGKASRPVSCRKEIPWHMASEMRRSRNRQPSWRQGRH
jgi:hypothetical protein